VFPLHLAGFAVGGAGAVIGFLQVAMWLGHANVLLGKTVVGKRFLRIIAAVGRILSQITILSGPLEAQPSVAKRPSQRRKNPRGSRTRGLFFSLIDSIKT
jgi:hypothetical protein